MISFCGTVSKAFAAKSCNVRFDRDYYLDPRRQIFGKDFPITIAPMPEMLMADSSLQIEQWLKKILQENAGGNMKITCPIEPDYSSKIIKELIHVIDTFTKPKVPILSAELTFNQNRTIVTK